MKRNRFVKQIVATVCLLVMVSGTSFSEESNMVFVSPDTISEKINAIENRQRLLYQETRQITDGLIRLQELEKAQKDLSDELKKLRDVKDVRQVLEISKNEAGGRNGEALSLAGNAYTLRRQGSLGLDYDLTYTYTSSDSINFQTVQEAANGITTTTTNASVEDTSNHKMVTTLSPEFGIFNNFTAVVNIPLVYKYNNTEGGNADDSADITDLGDVRAGFQWQPFKTGWFFGSPVVNISMTFPTGTSPYETTHKKYMSTGSGFYSASADLVFSKAYDPLIVYGNIGYTDNQGIDDLDQNRDGDVLLEVEPGDDLSLGFGVAYALSYKASMNAGINYTSTRQNDYTWRTSATQHSLEEVVGMLHLGCGLKYSKSQMIIVTSGIGLTDDSPDFTFSIRLPFNIN